MRTFIVHAHPEPSSFCSALTRCAVDTLTKQGHAVDVSDLYAMGFDPVGGPWDFTHRAHVDRFAYQREQMAAAASGSFEPTLAREMERVRAADVLMLHFPLWWFGLPAILKGWVDRVFAMGFAYGASQSHDTGPLRGRRAMLTLTTGAPSSAFEPPGVNGDINALLFPIQYGVLHFAGMDVLPPFVAFGAARCDEEQRSRYLREYTARLRRIGGAQPLSFDPYDVATVRFAGS